MRFVVRKGTDPVARADTTILKALGLPFGGVFKVGPTHFLVQGGDPSESTALELGPITLANARTSEGQSIEAGRAVLGPAEVVVIDVDKPRSRSKAPGPRPPGSPHVERRPGRSCRAPTCPAPTLRLHDQTGRTRPAPA